VSPADAKGLALACFFCGVDSTALIVFLGLIIGGGVLSLVCFVVWGIMSGHLRDEKNLARAALDAEGIQPEEHLP